MNEVTLVTEQTQVIIHPVYNSLELSSPGPQGPQGPAGTSGGSHFIYNRNGIPAASWPITHNLNRRAHVSIIGDDGKEVDSDVTHNDLNNLTIDFAQPFSGVAVIG